MGPISDCGDSAPAGAPKSTESVPNPRPATGPQTTESRSTTKTSVEPAGISGEGDCLP